MKTLPADAAGNYTRANDIIIVITGLFYEAQTSGTFLGELNQKDVKAAILVWGLVSKVMSIIFSNIFE